MTSEAKNTARGSTGTGANRILPYVVGVIVGFAVLEGIKEAFFPGLTKWESHVISFFMVAIISAGFMALFRHQLRQAEEEVRFQADLLDTVGQAVIATDIQGRVGYWNRAAEDLYGWTSQEVMGRPAIEVVISEDQIGWTEEIMPEVKAGRSWSGEVVMRRKDGTSLPAIVTATPVQDEQGNLVGITRVCADITERKRAEEALRESEERFRAFFETAAVGAAQATPTTGRLLRVNDKLCQLVGYGRDELLSMTFFDITHPDDRARDQEELSRLLKGESREYLTEKRYLRKDGQVVWALLAVTLVRGRSDQPLHTVATIQDITERKQLEDNQQRFLANAAHQLRTPITAVVGAAELLATRKSMNSAVRDRLLDHILVESRRMQRLANTLLRMARVGRDLRELHLKRVNLSQTVEQVAKRMEPLAESAQIAWRFEGEGGCVRADPEWLEEALLILLSNAIQHSSSGASIVLHASSDTIIVEDEGAGISPEDLPHVFERFYRGKGNSKGFGLGLSICRELIEHMGGSISISSREGSGTAVKIKLPGWH